MVKVCEAGFIEQDLVHQALEKVKVNQEISNKAKSRKKSYTYIRRKPLQFDVDDWVYL